MKRKSKFQEYLAGVGGAASFKFLLYFAFPQGVNFMKQSDGMISITWEAVLKKIWCTGNSKNCYGRNQIGASLLEMKEVLVPVSLFLSSAFQILIWEGGRRFNGNLLEEDYILNLIL